MGKAKKKRKPKKSNGANQPDKEIPEIRRNEDYMCICNTTPLNVKIINPDRAAIIISIISIAVAIASTMIVVYFQFLQKHVLSANFNQIIMLRLPEQNKQQVIADIIINNLISDDPSIVATYRKHITPYIKDKVLNIEDAIENKDKDRLTDMFKKLKIKNFSPQDDILKKYIGVQAFSPTFCIPLVISNAGAKFAEISNIYLVAISQKDNEDKWIFNCHVEMDIDSLLHRKDQTDSDRVENIFIGPSIAPREKMILYPIFFPLWNINGKIISHSMPPGTYEFHIEGYSSDGKKLFITKPMSFNLKVDSIIKMFKGTDLSTLNDIDIIELIRRQYWE